MPSLNLCAPYITRIILNGILTSGRGNVGAGNTLEFGLRRMRILVVEDDPHMQKVLRIGLASSDYIVLEAATGRKALAAIRKSGPEMIILDLGLPDMDGKDVVREARELTNVPIIVLSARDSETEKIRALDLGANDYVEKPFEMGELLARIRTAQRSVSEQARIDVSGLVVDTKMRWVKKNGVQVKLTRTEYELLVLLARRAGETLSHGEILTALLGAERQAEIGHLRVLVRQLRVKIEDDAANPRFIQTAPGVGYIFAGPEY
jgi:two-component system KDP operon response regulator KdpE